MKRRPISFILLSVLLPIFLILLDQISKIAARKALASPPKDIILLPGVLRLHYLENRGAAWGIFQGRYGILSVISVLLIVLFVFILFRIPKENKRFLPFTLVVLFVLSGAFGNLIDRVVFGYVTDFIYFELINFPIFNVADIYVTCSVFVLAFLILFYYKDEELSFLPFFGTSQKGGDKHQKKDESVK